MIKLRYKINFKSSLIRYHYNLILLLVVLITNNCIATKDDIKPIDWVDVFVGTSNSRWMLGPYATAPFGMVQLGPDNQGQVWMGGYDYAINSISGFSH